MHADAVGLPPSGSRRHRLAVNRYREDCCLAHSGGLRDQVVEPEETTSSRIVQLFDLGSAPPTVEQFDHVVLFTAKRCVLNAMQLAILHDVKILGLPQEIAVHGCEDIRATGKAAGARGCLECDQRGKVLAAEDIVQLAEQAVVVLVSDVVEERTRLGEQVAGDRQTVTEVGQVRVDAQLPGVPGMP
jgi:hypothetical protein